MKKINIKNNNKMYGKMKIFNIRFLKNQCITENLRVDEQID